MRALVHGRGLRLPFFRFAALTVLTAAAVVVPAGALKAASGGGVSAPILFKAFGAGSIPFNTSTSLTFTIANSNPATPLTGVAFSDVFPAGLVVSTPSGATGTCNGGTFTAAAGSTTVSLTGGVIAAATNCVLTVNVTGTAAGPLTNTTGNVSAAESGAGSTATATLLVGAPPVISAPIIFKMFGSLSVPLNGTTTLQLNVANLNASTSLTGLTVSDVFPAGLVVATPSGATGNCNGGTFTAVAGSSSISLTGGVLGPIGNCLLTVNVTGTSLGAKVNTTGHVSAAENAAGDTATATLLVEAPPLITKVFSPLTVNVGNLASLNFTIINPLGNILGLSGVAFTDVLPAGLTVTNATATVCGGTLTLTAPSTIALTNAFIADGSSCGFVVLVGAHAVGALTNTTGNVTSTNGGTGNVATATLQVDGPMTIAKAFQAPEIPLAAPIGLTFTVRNPASLTQHNVAFTDSLPAGLVVASPNGFTGACSVGAALTLTAVPGSSTISETGDVYPAGGSCTFTVNVIGTSPGVKNNSVVVTSTEQGVSATANASITIDPVVPSVEPMILVAIAFFLAAIGVATLRRRRRLIDAAHI